MKCWPGITGLRRKSVHPGLHWSRFQTLQQWQRQRLAESYSDLINQESYRPACEFFLEELYGGLDFLKRDQEVAKVMSVMVRFLPGKALLALADAFELQALSLEFDLEMAERLDSTGAVELDVASYGEIYRSCGNRPLRERQILLIRDLGNELAKLVHKLLVVHLIRLNARVLHTRQDSEQLQAICTARNRVCRVVSFPLSWKTLSISLTRFINAGNGVSMQKLFAGEAEPFADQAAMSNVQPKCSRAVKVAYDLFLDVSFQQCQKNIQFGLYPDFLFTHGNPAVHTGSFKMNNIFVPAVIDAEFPGEVTRKFVCRFLGMSMVHFVVGAHIDPGHKFQSNDSESGQFRRMRSDKPIDPYFAPVSRYRYARCAERFTMHDSVCGLVI